MWTAILVALASGSCTISIDPRAASIPTEVAVSNLKELLPKSSSVSFVEPELVVNQSEIRGWKVDHTGLEFQPGRMEPFRLAWSDSRGVELVKFPLRFELRIFVAVPGRRKDHLHITWKDGRDARHAAELFESLRGDR
jgi:hypothetical protein